MKDLKFIPQLVLQKDAKVKIICTYHVKSIVARGISCAAAIVCQIPLFFAQMVGMHGFDTTIILEIVATMCKAQKDPSIVAMKTEALIGVDSEAKYTTKANLYATTIQIETLLH